jgi:hypothetical protein
MPLQLPLPMGEDASYAADGAHLAYVPIINWSARTAWKRYRGGRYARAQADRLYSVCMKLKAPKSVGAGGGGGFNASGSNDKWWFWYVEFLNGQPPPTPKPDPCPNGDCRH